nr:DUF3293 domain-containing protein [Oleiagrimonas sp. C23AA]
MLKAYKESDYRVRLPSGGHASIRVDQPLPAPLAAMLADENEPWIFITAWNPRSRPHPNVLNRMAQRDLLKALREAGARSVCAALGVGQDGWRESSLFALGLSPVAQDILVRRFDQNASIRGIGAAPARLHVMQLD